MIKEVLFFCSIAGADYSTSRYIISKGGQELNPFLRGSEKKQILFHSGKCLLQGFVTSKVNPKKRKKLYIIGGIIGGSFVAWNGIQMRKVK